MRFNALDDEGVFKLVSVSNDGGHGIYYYQFVDKAKLERATATNTKSRLVE